jgi:hypothetical protein
MLKNKPLTIFVTLCFLLKHFTINKQQKQFKLK